MRWGAKAKVRDIDERYQDLFSAASDKISSEIIHTTKTLSASAGSSRTSSALDLKTVMKASLTISGEIVLDNLLAELMRILIENAGAQKGFLILETDSRLCIEAQSTTDSESVEVLQSIPVANCDTVSSEIVSYVARTQESVVLKDATQEGEFKNTDYIRANKPKSLLCLPLINQSKLSGILYLENNLTAGAFTPARLETLNLLSSQAAISIENSRLYTDLKDINITLEQKVTERTEDLNAKNKTLVLLNQTLEETLEQLKQNQAQLIQSEKMADLGQLIAGIAHEINTPLGVIRGSGNNIANTLNQTLHRLPELFQELSGKSLEAFFILLDEALHNKSQLTSREARKAKRSLVAKLETFDIESAAEIADILVDMGVTEASENILPLLQTRLAPDMIRAIYGLSRLDKNSRNIMTAVENASKIVFALRKFAHYDHSGEKVLTDITENIETVLTLYHNKIKRGVELVTNFAETPKIPCYPDELSQVWTNLIHNALQAIEFNGCLEICIKPKDDNIVVAITDNGPGISNEIQSRIFEPFFTTRARGEGSGLGLDICKKIIEKHEGMIEFDTEPGKTAFRVWLPI
ncbi:ATP-binding protein [Desulfococcaceae bacterium HSG9]|nr:ATP-binding protein [Desulfococcaceae bacterium HSG9]